MKLLHAITCSRYVHSMGAHEQFTRHLIRSKRLTHAGIRRMFERTGCEEYKVDPEISVVRVEVSQFV